MQPLLRRAIGLVLVCACGEALAQPGSIILTGDEWMVSNQAFTANATQTRQFVDNIGNCFDNGGPASFAVLTSHPVAYNTQFKNRLISQGHSVVTSPGGPFTLANLQQYDGVFLAGAAWSGAANAAALTAYVQGGGHVMVMAGTGSSAAAQQAAWSPFLSTFGLGLGGQFFAPPPGSAPLQMGVTPLPNAATVGLTSVSWSFGQTALDLNPSDPLNQVAAWGNFANLAAANIPGNPQSVPIIATWNIVPTPGTAAVMVVGLLLAAPQRRRR